MENLSLGDGDILALLAILEKITAGKYLSIVRLPSGWKVVLDEVPNFNDGGTLLLAQPSGMALTTALTHAIVMGVAKR